MMSVTFLMWLLIITDFRKLSGPTTDIYGRIDLHQNPFHQADKTGRSHKDLVFSTCNHH
jgi:hypothetical protein